MSGMSVRDYVQAISNEIRDTDDMTPARASELLMKLTALIGNVRTELRKREFDYNQVELDAYRSEEAANRAKMLARTSSQFLAFREAQDTLKLADGLVASLKYHLRLAEVEMKAMH